MQNQSQQGGQDNDGDWPGAIILERSSTVLIEQLD